MSDELQSKMFQQIAQKKVFEQARDYAYQYLDDIRERRVFPSTEDLEGMEHFVEELPSDSGDALKVLEQLNRYGAPGTTALVGGRYFGFVNGGVLPISLAAHWLATTWDQNAPLFLMSPVNAKIEQVCEAWLRELLGLPSDVVAGFVSGSATATYVGLAAARYRIMEREGWDINRRGLADAPRMRVITGRHTHSTVIKALGLLGFGTDNIEWVDVDEQGRMLVSGLPALDASCVLILQAGNVNSGSFDPFDDFCEKARAADAWVHIDGAFGLWAAATKRLKHLTRGIEKANSWSVDGHKTLNTPYDSGILLCNDKETLLKAMRISGSYLVRSANRDGMNYTTELSKRARAIDLWAALKFLGRSGVDELVTHLHERAVQFGRLLQDAGFEILNDVVFNQVIVACESNKLTELTLRYIQESGECWVGGADWFGKPIIRVSVCSWATTADDVARSVRAFVLARTKAMDEIAPG